MQTRTPNEEEGKDWSDVSIVEPRNAWAIVFFYFSFIIHMCIQGLDHFSPLPPPPPLPPIPPPPSPPPIPSRNYFALISNFVVERV
jgi:hypothetical protein